MARLARLALTDDELDSFSSQLGAIIEHVSQIQAVDVTDVEPTGKPFKVVNVARPDTTAPCLTQDEAVAAAPRSVEGRIAVPQILWGKPVSEIIHLDAAQLAAKIAGKELSSTEVTQAYLA